MTFVLILIGLVALLWFIGHFVLSGPDHTQWETPLPKSINSGRDISPAHRNAVEFYTTRPGKPVSLSESEWLDQRREMINAAGDYVDMTGITVSPVDINGVPGEWVVPDGADPDRRVLFYHGGAFTLGSPKSHRAMTKRLSRAANAAVLAVDYRLMPEFTRFDIIKDAETSYRWILENGPNGTAPIKTLIVAGDSAGGNMALTAVAWARDNKLRAADAVVTMSPGTDSSLSGTSYQSKLADDVVVKDLFGQYLKLPKAVRSWIEFKTHGVKSADRRLSPVFGELHGLPPVLLQASTSETLLHDSVRYANKANAAGSDATLELWDGLVHDWHIWVESLPEAEEAFQHIEAFLQMHLPDLKPQ